METDMTQEPNGPNSGPTNVNQAAIPNQTAPAVADYTEQPGGAKHGMPGNLDFVLDIPMTLTVELGRSQMLISELLKLGRGSVIELAKLSGEPLDILANQRLIARGEVVVVNEKYGIRITEIISPAERVEKLR